MSALRLRRLVLVGLAALAPCLARGESAIEQLERLLNSPNIPADARRRIQSQINRYRRQQQVNRKKEIREAQKESMEAIKATFEKGKEAYEQQRYGAAYLHFRTVASCRLKKAAKIISEAKAKVIEIEGLARAKLEQAEVMLRRGETTEAARMFVEVAESFPYSDQAQKATRRLHALRSTPSVAASLRYLEGKAQEDAESYWAALEIYDEVVGRWPDELAALRARVAARKIRSDPDKMALAREGMGAEAMRVCPTLLSLAESYLLNGDEAHAVEKLRQVVNDYPGTSYADRARAMLEALAPEGAPPGGAAE
jgi:tetratricopeptide (TPR) repeat protein